MNGNGKFKRVEFFYVVPRQTVPANGISQPQLTIQGDFDFEMHQVMVQRTSGALTVEMFDAAAGGAGFQSAPVPIDLWGGTGQLPFSMIPQVWKKRQQFSFRLTDASGAPNVTDLVFFGYKLIPA